VSSRRIVPQDAANNVEVAPFVPTRLQLVTDWANLCTLLGAVLATFAMACMWKKQYYLGMFLSVSANIADIIDGPIARSFPNRHPTYSTIGSKLDCYSDLISHFVVPASLLMNLSDMHPICTVLAALYVCSGIVRQSYFEVTGRCNNGTCIYGLTSDYMVAIYCMTMLLLPAIGLSLMVFVLSCAIVFMMFGSLTFSLRSRRYDGFDLFTVILFNVLLWFSCLILVFYAVGDFAVGAGILFIINITLTYPLYFRFVELNR
jgi:phosphatidylserine synthase